MTRDEIEKEAMKFLDHDCIEAFSESDRAYVTFAEHILRVAESNRLQPIDTAQKDEQINKINTNEILQWRKYNIEFLAVEHCKDELKNAVKYGLIPEVLFSRCLASRKHGLNTAEMAIFLAELCEKFIFICNAYDEQSKHLRDANKGAEINASVTKNFCNKNIALKSRISTLEALLRDVNERFDSHKQNNDGGYYCEYCNAVSWETIKHKPDCLFTRIQKELGEG